MRTGIDSFLSDALSYAGQLAFAEEASGTFALLEHLSRIFRYWEHREEAIRLSDELVVLSSLLEIVRIRYPGRLRLSVETPDEDPFITKYALLHYIQKEIGALIDGTSQGYILHLRFLDEDNRFRAELSGNLPQKQYFEIPCK